MDLRAAILAGAGLLASGVAAVNGGLSTGYGMGPFAILIRIGVGWLTLGILTTVVRPKTIRQGVECVAVTCLVIFVVGSGLMYYDLAITPPEYGTPLTLSLLVSTQFQLLLITLPIPAGYLAGVLLRDDEPLAGALTLLAVFIGSPILGSRIAVAGGSAPGFTGAFFFTATTVCVVFALLPLLLMGWVARETRGIGADTLGMD